jgi:carboxypeptidase C (cathepsin A)
MHRFRLACFILFVASSILLADEPTTQPGDDKLPPVLRGLRGTTAPARESEDSDKPTKPDKPVTTEHEITIDGKPLKYRATTGLMPLKDDAGKPRAKVFYVYYEKAGEKEEVAARPVTFVFNGGPGSASIWLHLGTAGPKRVQISDDGTPPAPPYKLQDNPYSWLSFTDLVFIDPVGTGFSRPSDAERAREFYGVQGDISSVADFIRLFCTNYGRWPSPKFLAGESYGTTRAAGLSEYLHDRFGTEMNGIVLISTVLNFQTINPSAGNDLPFPLFLPGYTACAWYHKKLSPELQANLKAAVDAAQTWAMTDYAAALAKGTSLDDASRQRVVDKLVEFTGLPREYVNRSNLKVGPSRFEKALLADQRKVIGRMDGRITGFDADPLNDTPDFDPSMSGYMGLFTATFNDYVRNELKYEDDAVYEVLSSRVSPWDFGPAGSGYLNVATTLREAMTKSPSLKVLVASGYFDLATPFAAADYTIDQMPLSKELRSNITQTYYEGGHMMYLARPALVQLHADLKSFYESAVRK